MADYKVTDTELTSIANAIRTKGGTSSPLVFPTGFVSAVNAIPTGGGGDTDLKDYIESSGTQYIDTGYAPNINTCVEAIALVNSVNDSWAALFGKRTALNANSFIYHVRYGGSNGISTQVSSSPNNYTQADVATVYSRKTIFCLRNLFSGFAVLDPLQCNEIATTAMIGSSLDSLYLLCLNQSGSPVETTYCSAKLYRVRIYESDVLIHEFLPHIDGNGVACLKDTITGNIKYNAGTGDFVYGTDS